MNSFNQILIRVSFGQNSWMTSRFSSIHWESHIEKLFLLKIMASSSGQAKSKSKSLSKINLKKKKTFVSERNVANFKN